MQIFVSPEQLVAGPVEDVGLAGVDPENEVLFEVGLGHPLEGLGYSGPHAFNQHIVRRRNVAVSRPNGLKEVHALTHCGMSLE